MYKYLYEDRKKENKDKISESEFTREKGESQFSKPLYTHTLCFPWKSTKRGWLRERERVTKRGRWGVTSNQVNWPDYPPSIVEAWNVAIYLHTKRVGKANQIEKKNKKDLFSFVCTSSVVKKLHVSREKAKSG